MEKKYKEFIITDDKSKANPNAVKELLSTSYWAQNRDIETIKKTIENSVCFSVFKDDKQIGFARVVTDHIVFAWIADVIINEDYRKQGIGKCLIQTIEEHPLIPSSTQVLKTKDAHGLYEKYGFEKSEFMSK